MVNFLKHISLKLLKFLSWETKEAIKLSVAPNASCFILAQHEMCQKNHSKLAKFREREESRLIFSGCILLPPSSNIVPSSAAAELPRASSGKDKNLHLLDAVETTKIYPALFVGHEAT